MMSEHQGSNVICTFDPISGFGYDMDIHGSYSWLKRFNYKGYKPRHTKKDEIPELPVIHDELKASISAATKAASDQEYEKSDREDLLRDLICGGKQRTQPKINIDLNRSVEEKKIQNLPEMTRAVIISTMGACAFEPLKAISKLGAKSLEADEFINYSKIPFAVSITAEYLTNLISQLKKEAPKALPLSKTIDMSLVLNFCRLL